MSLLYGQGIYDFNFYANNDKNLYFSNKISTANIASTVDLGAIQGGVGNSILIQIPTNFQLTISMTAADFSIRGIALNTGSTIMPNGIHRIKESVAIDAQGKGKVLSIPTADLGSASGRPVGWINNGVMVEIDPDTMEFTVPDPISDFAGKVICLTYTTTSSSAEYFRVGSVIEPTIGRAVLTSPLYSTEGDTASGGILWGELQIFVPKAQLNGNLNIDLSQTAPSSTILDMTALADFSTQLGGCQSKDGTLCYIVVNKFTGDVLERVSDLVVLGGGISLEVDEEERIIVKGMTPDGLLENIPYNRLKFVMENPSIATVINTGVLSKRGTVTALTSGDTECMIYPLLADGVTVDEDMKPVRVDVEVIPTP